MKKLVIVVSVVCAAIFAQGAAVDWKVARNATEMTQNATVYAFLASDSAKVTTALAGLADVAGFEEALGAAEVSYSGGYSSGTGNGRGAVNGILMDANIADKASVGLMLVVFDAAGKNYTTVSGINGTAYTAETASTAVPADFSESFSSATWTPLGGGGGAPEPTSGLLLLVGGSLLALRRKRS